MIDETPGFALEVMNYPTDDYVAGYFDGEGCVGFHDRGGDVIPRIRISVMSANLPSLRALQARFGGQLYLHSLPSARRKSRYNWRIGSMADCISFIAAVEPHSIEKRAQLALARQWLQHREEIPLRGRRSAETYRLAKKIRALMSEQKRLDFYDPANWSKLCSDESADIRA